MISPLILRITPCTKAPTEKNQIQPFCTSNKFRSMLSWPIRELSGSLRSGRNRWKCWTSLSQHIAENCYWAWQWLVCCPQCLYARGAVFVSVETKTIDFQTSATQFSDRWSHQWFEFFPKNSHTKHIFCWQYFLKLFVITYIYFVLRGAVKKE